jgi:hypothetical protein
MLVISACRISLRAPSRIMSGMMAAAVNHMLIAHICAMTSMVIDHSLECDRIVVFQAAPKVYGNIGG